MKHSEVKQHIIETASELFYKNGYNLTGINEVIAEAGIAKATLYNHFKAKEDLCLAYLQHKNTAFLTNIEAFCRSKKKGKNQVTAIFDFLHEFFQSKAFNGCWCINTISELPRKNERVKKEIQHQKELFINLIKDLVVDNMNILKPAAVKTLSRQIYLLYESAVAESHLHQNDWPIKEMKKLCLRILD